jgi:hypothetical protein
MMAGYSLDTVSYGAELGRTLDFSEGSLQDIEAMLAQLHNEMPGRFGRLIKRGPSEDDLALLAKMFGGYVGYVMRFEWGEGEWKIPEDGPFAGAICLAYGTDTLISPPAKVYKRIVDGPADDILSYYRVLSDGRKEKKQ